MSPRPARRAAATLVALALTGCATTAPHSRTGDGRVVRVVAAENVWGNLAAALGGAHAKVTSVIDNPDADPHDYEPTAADARSVGLAQLAVINGVGYDTWASRLAAANPSDARITLTVGDLVGVKPGGNPHRWYAPSDVRAVLDRITADYQRLDPADADYFAARHRTVLDTDLAGYFATIQAIRGRYAGTPVGASESILAPLAQALGLDLITPARFLSAISQGSDPTATDKATIDDQIKNKKIRVYVYNRQNATPDIQAQVALARAAGIPVTTITETITPAGASFQQWQVAQLDALRDALARGAGSA